MVYNCIGWFGGGDLKYFGVRASMNKLLIVDTDFRAVPTKPGLKKKNKWKKKKKWEAGGGVGGYCICRVSGGYIRQASGG